MLEEGDFDLNRVFKKGMLDIEVCSGCDVMDVLRVVWGGVLV